MKKLIAAVTLAIATIAGFRATISKQKEEIERLHTLIDNEDIDDAERDAKLKELEDLETEAGGKADELAEILNGEPAVPSVNPETFEVTEPATGTANDLAFRDRQDETAGKTAEPAPAPAASESDKQTS